MGREESKREEGRTKEYESREGEVVIHVAQSENKKEIFYLR